MLDPEAIIHDDCFVGFFIVSFLCENSVAVFSADEVPRHSLIFFGSWRDGVILKRDHTFVAGEDQFVEEDDDFVGGMNFDDGGDGAI